MAWHSFKDLSLELECSTSVLILMTQVYAALQRLPLPCQLTPIDRVSQYRERSRTVYSVCEETTEPPVLLVSYNPSPS